MMRDVVIELETVVLCNLLFFDFIFIFIFIFIFYFIMGFNFLAKSFEWFVSILKKSVIE